MDIDQSSDELPKAKKLKKSKVTEETISSKKEKSDFLVYQEFITRNFVTIACIKLVIIGLIIRLISSSSSLGELDENESLSLLIGNDVPFSRFTTLRYGHHFSGVIEYLVTTPIVSAFSMTTFSARIIPLLFLIATSFVLWRAFTNTPYKDTMRLVLGSLWIFSGTTIFSSMKLTGYVSATILLQVIILASAYYAAHSLRNLRYFYIWAFVSGLACWTNSATLWLLTVPGAYWIFISAPSLKKHKFKALGLFALGASPLLISAISDRFFPLVNTYDKDAGTISDGLTDPFSAMFQTLGFRTFTSNDFLTAELGIISLIIFVAAYGTIIYLAGSGITTIKKLKKTDFAQLQILVLVSHVIFISTFFILSRQVNYKILATIIVPFIFIAINADKSRIKITALICCMLITSSFSLVVSNREFFPKHHIVQQGESALRSNDIKFAVAPKNLAFAITVESEDKITVTPFDGNNFDQVRSKKVNTRIQAIVVEAKNKKQNDLAFCVQGYFGDAFERIETKDAFIYLVDKNLQSKTSKVIKECNDQGRN